MSTQNDLIVERGLTAVAVSGALKMILTVVSVE